MKPVYHNQLPAMKGYLPKRMQLRDYQQEAVNKIRWAENMEGNDLIVLPTGAGKSLVIAEIANQKDTPVLIFQPSKEILEQNMGKLSEIVGEAVVGVYSASLARKEIKKYTFATIGSVKNKFSDFQHFKLVIIDEAHLVNPKSTGSMYMKFLEKIGNPKCIGLTATPYRLTPQYMRYPSGYVETITTIKLVNRVRPKFWDRLLTCVNVGQLIAEGYLCPLEYHLIPLINQEDIKLNRSRSDFDLEAFEKQIAGGNEKINKVLNSCLEHFVSTLVFCSSVEQAEDLASWFDRAEVVSAKTSKKERDRIINGFKSGEIKMVMNVGVLTTGFDHPALDCVVLLRPTRSIGLYYQMLGRGLRKAEGKKVCHIVDMTDTVKKIGRVETIKVEKVDGKWELLTERGSWHAKELYRFEIQK